MRFSDVIEGRLVVRDWKKMKKQSQFIWMDGDYGQQQQEDWQPIVHVKQSRKVKTNKSIRQFVGWGSKQLIDFLASIGVDTATKLSQEEVTDIVYKYINANNLINPSKKKRVVCDDKLQLLFGRKTVGRIKIFGLLERHLAENQEQSASDDDEMLYSSDEGVSVTPKRKAVSSAEKKTHKKAKQEPASNDSCFAEVIPENIKLVFLKKSLVQELSKDLETFENKISGTFVRIKSDPHDITQKNYYQLVRVAGIKKPTGTEDLEKQLLLKVCNSFKDISISLLSEDDFSQEECEDLQRRIKDGLLERLTVVEMEQKAQILHQDITKHWIKKELVRLQNLIDYANQKGWRRELTDYIDRRMLLQTPSEQTRLLQESPKVIAEKIVSEPAKEATPEPEPESKEMIVPEPTEKKYFSDASDFEDDWLDSFLKIAEESRAKASIANGTTTAADPAPVFKPEFPAAEDQVLPENTINEGDALTPAKVSINEGNQDKMHNLIVIDGHKSNSEEPVESPKSETTVFIPNDKLIIPGTDITAESLETNSPLPKVDGKLSSPFGKLTVSVKDLACSAEVAAKSPKHETPVSNGKQGVPAVIELSDDDDDKECTSSLFFDQPESPIWQYMDPQGAVQGPFSLLSMKRWADANYFPPGFMIWKKGVPHMKYALSEVLRQSFSNHRRSRKS